MTAALDPRLQQAIQGDREALGLLWAEHERFLLRGLAMRLDPRLRGRVDASDVLQNAAIQVTRRIGELQNQPGVPFRAWLWFLAQQELAAVHRQHLGAKGRDVRKQVSIFRSPLPEASSVAIAEFLCGRFTSASQKAIRSELKLKIQEALAALNERDREILALRHFDQLSNREIEHLLNMTDQAAAMRYVRALDRLRAQINDDRFFEDLIRED